MIVAGDATSALTLLVLLSGGLLQLSTSSPLAVAERGVLTPARGEVGERQEGAPRPKEPPGGGVVEEEEEDELFKDVDPRALAAVLLGSMNKPAEERRRAGEGEVAGDRGEAEGEEEEAGAAEGADRDRDGREELELAVAAAQGKEAREREEEAERRRKQEEEDRLTEKVTSRTSSHAIPAKTGETLTAMTAGGDEGGLGKEAGDREEAREKAPSSQEEAQQQEKEEEQLSPEEVKNLETMLGEFQSLSATSKRERQREMEREGEEERERERQSLVQRESRGYSPALVQGLPANDVVGKPKGHQLAMSKKKLKWQEETQKAAYFPNFRGGNFMDDFDNTAADEPQRPSPEDEGVDEEEEEVLSPEEEEARARVEQVELERQAVEAQRAKEEEEKLADIASDMLLQYMVKQDGGGRKYADKSRKKAPSISNGNAAEDKRSDEEAAAAGDVGDDDIDPQTIEKLIEISSRLHLPADDVVDIISDVEKKKKKDAPGGPEGATSPWQRPPLSANAANTVQSPPLPPPRNSAPKQPPPPPVNPLKAWFKENVPLKPTNQELWIAKPPQSFRGPSSFYPPHPSYQKTYRGYYPIYFPPPKPPKPRYYPKPRSPLALSDLLGNDLDYDLTFPPKRRYRPWVQPRPRRPPSATALQRNLYLSDYILPQRPRTFNPYLYPAPMPKPRSAPWAQGRRRPPYYYAPPGPLVTRDDDYDGRAGPRTDSAEDLENFIQQLLRKRPRMFQ